jgi:hypothetical protein
MGREIESRQVTGRVVALIFSDLRFLGPLWTSVSKSCILCEQWKETDWRTVKMKFCKKMFLPK